MELDAGVGEILKKLRELKIDRDTFVFFSSDNGAATYAFTEGLLRTYRLYADIAVQGMHFSAT